MSMYTQLPVSYTHLDVYKRQADEIDLASHRGWSILVTGIAQRVTRPAELDCASPLLQAWVSEPQPMLVKVPSTLISGRWLLWGDR